MKLARLNDATTGSCAIHGPQSGTITSASGDVSANSLGVARVGDTVTAACGHTGSISSGAARTSVNGSPAARINDSFTGTYSGTITGGSPNVDENS
jgi:uncharacterized Zn-binding protein involved in type VI secretion